MYYILATRGYPYTATHPKSASIGLFDQSTRSNKLKSLVIGLGAYIRLSKCALPCYSTSFFFFFSKKMHIGFFRGPMPRSSSYSSSSFIFFFVCLIYRSEEENTEPSSSFHLKGILILSFNIYILIELLI